MSEDREGTASAARARIEISDLVPDGMNMVEVELETETVLVMRTGMIRPELADEWNHHMAHATAVGRWTRTPGPDESPSGHPDQGF